MTYLCYYIFLTITILQGVFSSISEEVKLNVTGTIAFFGYPAETRTVKTSDGYILTLHRIPYGKKSPASKGKPVVFLQHGLFDSSFTWVNNQPSGSLAFILADAGYDVWMGNSRGNVYSRAHTSLSSSSQGFWDFTWNEMAEYDFPASINYVLGATGAAQLNYVGHSQGAAIAFAKLSANTEINRKIASFVALAPAVLLGHTVGLHPTIKALLYALPNGEFLPGLRYLTMLINPFCTYAPDPTACNNILFLLTKTDTTNFDMNRVPIYTAHVPAGTSTKNIIHYSQSIDSGKFQKFDRGYLGNLIAYGNGSPPKYGFTINNVPIAIFYGGLDKSVTPVDVEAVIANLGSAVKYKKMVPNYGHADFVWAKDANTTVYKDLLNFMCCR